MYGLSVRLADSSTSWVRSCEIARMITDNQPTHPDTVRQLFAIEELENRGCKYSNHDFDVLSAAYSFANSRPLA